MSNIANNIQADARTLQELLRNKKYEIDYFQREYKWEKKHIEQLIVDLESAFLSNYDGTHTLADVSSYNSYYMGPVVICEKGNIRSIVDGQQRLTSLTLLLIYLNRLQKKLIDDDDLIQDIDDLIYSKKHGRKSYNLEVPDRAMILESLYNDKDFNIELETDESVRNMYDRFQDIEINFPDELHKIEILPLFIDWLKEKLAFVEIVAYTDENAYTIFETMNDRGLNLTATEMLKGFILSNIKDYEKVKELNSLWKNRLSELNNYGNDEDSEFIKAWLRGHYADTIRSKSVGAGNEDFEKIGTRFHTWVKDNSKKINLRSEDSFYFFIKGDFDFYLSIYAKIKNAEWGEDQKHETLFLISYWSLASSLTYPLILAPINKLDDEETINAKIVSVANFIDIYTIYRVLSNRSITQTSLRYTMYSLVKEIRNSSVEELREKLKNKIIQDNFSPNDFKLTRYHYQNKFFQYLLARMTFYIEKENRTPIPFDELMVTRKKNRYVVKNIMPLVESDKSDSYFAFGNYILVQNPVAQAMYEKNDTLVGLRLVKGQPVLAASIFKTFDSGSIILSSITEFNAESIAKRTEEYRGLIERVWSIDNI